jgi:hypothetical protein
MEPYQKEAAETMQILPLHYQTQDAVIALARMVNRVGDLYQKITEGKSEDVPIAQPETAVAMPLAMFLRATPKELYEQIEKLDNLIVAIDKALYH